MIYYNSKHTSSYSYVCSLIFYYLNGIILISIICMRKIIIVTFLLNIIKNIGIISNRIKVIYFRLSIILSKNFIKNGKKIKKVNHHSVKIFRG